MDASAADGVGGGGGSDVSATTAADDDGGGGDVSAAAPNDDGDGTFPPLFSLLEIFEAEIALWWHLG